MANGRRALITGASGQDGYYLTRCLAARGREVLGIDRLAPPDEEGVGRHLTIDITAPGEVRAVLADFAPDEIYHLAGYHRSSAAQVSVSEAEEEGTYYRVNIEATRSLLRATHELLPRSRVFLAGSSHIFGHAEESPQNEKTPIQPNSLYGITKANNLWLGRYYRETLGLHCAMGILYNHESPRRGPTFVTARIARAAARIARGQEQEELVLGDLEAQVDWGFAGDVAEAMVSMLEADRAQDFIIASGQLHRVRDFVEIAFAHVGLDWRRHVRQGAGVHLPVARAVYHGDITAIRGIGWAPRVSFEELVHQMVDAAMGSS
ncbi:MAG TPA: GDP-mannose 4,6-dehydratase [Polyangia bacterium]|nr:GDP-mannose 4,6-dehydratase [Polyangia bacterium]